MVDVVCIQRGRMEGCGRVSAASPMTAHPGKVSSWSTSCTWSQCSVVERALSRLYRAWSGPRPPETRDTGKRQDEARRASAGEENFFIG